jgi:putative tryptophan/tyrosine transport system substrate-binding protein
MRRREVIAGLAGAAASPFMARAQQVTVPVIGFLNSGSAPAFQRHLDAFRQGLEEAGYIEGRNVAIDYRWGEGQQAQLPGLAAALVRRRVSVIAATGGSMSAHAAMKATVTVPIVFIAGPDPVADGLVQSLSRPGGNATGFAMMTSQLMPKRLELLLELVPRVSQIALLLNPVGIDANAVEKDVEAATRSLGREIVLLKVIPGGDLETAFVSAVEQHVDALLVSPSAVFMDRRAQIVALAARYSLPTAFPWREYAEEGGLMSYGPSVAWAYHQTGLYVGRILKGDKPTDLPVQQVVKFELVINLKTAKALGLTIPETLLATADEVIQ